MADFPAGLPGPMVDGVTYSTDSSNIIRTQFPGGQKVRRRHSWAPEMVTVELVLSRAQVQILWDFVMTTVKIVEPFTWREFRDPAGGPAVYRFREVPTFTPEQTGRLWRARLSLDLLTPFNGTFPLGGDLGPLSTDDDEILTT